MGKFLALPPKFDQNGRFMHPPFPSTPGKLKSVFGRKAGIWICVFLSVSAAHIPIHAALTETPVVTSFPVGVARWVSDPVRPRLYGIDSPTHHVYVFDTSTLSLVQTISLGASPQRGAVSPDGSRLYLTNDFYARIMRIDLDTLQVLTPLVLADSTPFDVQVGGDGYLYISTGSGLSKVDSATGEVKSSIYLDAGFVALQTSPDGHTLYFGATTQFGRIGKFDISGETPVLVQESTNFNEQDSGYGFTLSHSGQLLAYADGIAVDGDAYSPAAIFSTADLTQIEGYLASTDYGHSRSYVAFSLDDSVVYQGYNSSSLVSNLLISLRSAARSAPLEDLVVSTTQYWSLTPLALDQTGQFLWASAFGSVFVYNVAPRLEPEPLIGVVGSTLAYQVKSTFDPTSWTAKTLPPGLEISNTGLISGTPTESGNYTTTITAERDTVSVSATFTFQIDGTRLKNISTRAFMRPQDYTLIGGFIIEGTAPKKVVVRVLGPSLGKYGLLVSSDPSFYVYDSKALVVANNDDWQSFGDDGAAVLATGLAPEAPPEAAAVVTLDPGAYTVVGSAKGASADFDPTYSGTVLLEVYDIDENSLSRLANISSRASYYPSLGPEIAGTIVSGPGSDPILIRALGPSLAQQGVSDPMQDPMLELHDSQGTLMAANDSWRDTQEDEIIATGIPPADDRECAILMNLPAGQYTAVLQTTEFTFSICLLEVYHLHH